jgi:hypothetical protein
MLKRTVPPSGSATTRLKSKKPNAPLDSFERGFLFARNPPYSLQFCHILLFLHLPVRWKQPMEGVPMKTHTRKSLFQSGHFVSVWHDPDSICRFLDDRTNPNIEISSSLRHDPTCAQRSSKAGYVELLLHRLESPMDGRTFMRDVALPNGLRSATLSEMAALCAEAPQILKDYCHSDHLNLVAPLHLRRIVGDSPLGGQVAECIVAGCEYGELPTLPRQTVLASLPANISLRAFDTWCVLAEC